MVSNGTATYAVCQFMSQCPGQVLYHTHPFCYCPCPGSLLQYLPHSSTVDGILFLALISNLSAISYSISC